MTTKEHENSDKRAARPDQTLTLRLEPEETVALYACLCGALERGVEQSGKVSAVRRRLGDMLASGMRRTAKTDKLLEIAERLTKGMQAEAYIKSQERKIEGLRGDAGGPADDSMDHGCEGDDCKAEALPSPADVVELELEEEEDEPAREYPRRSAGGPPPPVVPHLGRRRRAHRR